MIFKENMIFRLKNEKYRIVGKDVIRKNIFIIELSEKVRWPQVIREEELEIFFGNNKAVEVKDNNFMDIKTNNNTEEILKKRDFYYEIVCFLLKNNTNYDIYYSKSRKSILEEAMNKYNVSYSTFKRILNNYLKGGKIIDSLIPKIYNCGGRGKERNVNRAIDIKNIFKKGINKYYNTSKKNTLKVCYELIIRDFLKENPECKIPTINQFYYWYKKISKDNKQNEISNRFGNRIYQQTSRAIIGNSLQDASAPAELYQIDSTILDVYIVSKINRNLIIGRPVLYFVIDVYSRMIVGMNVTIEPFNSYEGVKVALINTMSDKGKYCKKFGIEIEKNQWDAKSVPSRILADRGELLSGNIENAITNLGIMIQNTPPYRGDMKGVVEKSFERVHSYIKPFCEGVVENKFNKIERGDEDYRLRANLTLEEITKIVIMYVLFNNNNHVLTTYEGDGLNISNDIPKIPSKIWEYGIKEKKGLLRELPEEVIRINLLNNKEVTVTAKGVKVNGLYYVSSWTLEEGWFQKSRIEGSFKIRISYNPNDISFIYYIKEGGVSFDELTLVSYQAHYKDLGEEELKQVIEYEKKLNKEAENKEIQAKINLYDEIKKVTSNAKEESERTKDMSLSKSRRLKNIRGNLEAERKIYKDNNMEEENNDDLSDFEEIMEEEWGADYE